MPQVVAVSTEAPPWLAEVAERAVAAAYDSAAAAPDLAAALDLARDLGQRLGAADPDGLGGRWDVLATLGAVDLSVARAAEPHLDALGILHEAGLADLAGDGTWGVYAAEGPRRLHASSGPEGWRLDGEKPWCSLADLVDHALVTAWTGEERGLFAVHLDHPGVTPLDGPPWVARGLPLVRSTGLALDAVPATPVGGPGWYLTRPGFWHGGIGVAAVWYGAAVAVARRLREAAIRREPDQVALVHLGRVDTALVAAAAVLREAAAHARAGSADGDLHALRARQVVADAVEVALRAADHGLGPAPLTLEEEHARRVADLRVYVRQHHAERDLARQGALAVTDRSW